MYVISMLYYIYCLYVWCKCGNWRNLKLSLIFLKVLVIEVFFIDFYGWENFNVKILFENILLNYINFEMIIKGKIIIFL